MQTVSYGEPVVNLKSALRSLVYGAHTDGSLWGPAHSRPRNNVYLVSRAAWLYNDSPFMLRAQSQKLPCFHHLRISFFFSPTRSSFTCLKAAVSYKSGLICAGLICAQLPFFVPQFKFRRSSYSLPPTCFIVFASCSFFPSTRSSFPCLRVAVSL